MSFLKYLLSHRACAEELNQKSKQIEFLELKLQGYQKPHIINRIETLRAKVATWERLANIGCLSEPYLVESMMRDVEELAHKTHLASAIINGETPNADES